jgi:hypothetical protein
MTPADFFNATLYLCGAAVLLAFTLALLATSVVGFVLFAGWLASMFKTDGKPGRPEAFGPNGEPLTIVHFDTGQVGTRPTPRPIDSGPTLNGRPDPTDYSEAMQ